MRGWCGHAYESPTHEIQMMSAQNSYVEQHIKVCEVMRYMYMYVQCHTCTCTIYMCFISSSPPSPPPLPLSLSPSLPLSLSLSPFSLPTFYLSLTPSHFPRKVGIHVQVCRVCFFFWGGGGPPPEGCFYPYQLPFTTNNIYCM